MAPPVITITRQYASGGSEVARLVAAELGWDVIDNEFVDEVARRAGLPPDAVAQREERAPGLLERLARTLAAGSPEMFIATAGVPRVEPDEAAIVQLTERVIAEAAAQGRIVLVGRGAQAVLAQRPDALHARSEEHTSELQSHSDLVCRLLLEKKKQPPTEAAVPTQLDAPDWQ